MENYYYRAELKYRLKQYAACISDYRLILKKFGERRDTYANLGMAYCFLNDSTQAILNLQKAISMTPAYARNHLNLGFVYLYFNHTTEAIPYLQKAIELDKNYAKAYYYLGYDYLITGKLDEAKKNFLKCLDLAIIHPESFYNLGLIASKEKNDTETIRYFTKALETRPSLATDARLFELRGKAYEHVGEKEKAQADLERAKKIENN